MQSQSEDLGYRSSKALLSEIQSFAIESRLTARETDVLVALCEGVVHIKDVAKRLEVSPNTVNNHVNSIFVKTRARSKSQLLSALLNRLAQNLENCRMMRRRSQVVIVDRDEQSTSELRMALEARDFGVRIAKNEAECVDRIRELIPQFVIVDLGSVSGTPREFMTSVVKDAPTQVLFVGGSDPKFDRARAMHIGAIDCFAKPLNPQELIDCLMSHAIEDDDDRLHYLRRTNKTDYKVANGELSLSQENCGTGGIFLRISEMETCFGHGLKVGDWVQVSVLVDPSGAGEKARLQASGQVVWMREAPEEETDPGAGVRVWGLSKSDRDKFRSFLSRRDLWRFNPSYIPGGFR